jgi:general secretion pathway protein G
MTLNDPTDRSSLRFVARDAGSRTEPAGSPVRRLRLQRGWTLIELLVVVSLIVILAGIAVGQYRTAVIRSQEAVLKTDLFRMRDAIDQYFADKAKYPPDLQALVTEGYLRAVPTDPFTQSDTSWVVVPAEPDPSNPTADLGVYDVKSAAEQSALDGSKYSDW